MKLILALSLLAVANANIFDDIGKTLGGVVHTVEHGVVDAANTVGHGVVDAANTVGHGVVDAAHTVGDGVVDAAHTVGDGVVDAAHAVGGALNSLGPTLGSTFGDVWNVVKDPLEQTGKQLLVQAAQFALEKGVTLALDALASGAGRRDVPDLETAKALVGSQLLDEFHKWLKETENQVKGSRQEMAAALLRGYNNMPQNMKTYLSEYVSAVLNGNTNTFVMNQANTAMKNALDQLKQRLSHRMQTALSTIRQG